MTAPDTVIVNTLEQILSTDLNRIGGLAGKSVQDALAMLEGGIDLSVTQVARSCVRKGLSASPGTGMAVLVTPGEVMRFDVGTSGTDVSQYLLGRLASETSVAIDAADAANPRVDVIYATLSASDQDSTTRNILTLPARTIAPAAVFKSRRPLVTLGYDAGTPAANPDFATAVVPAGSVALWYVYVPALATSITDAHLIDARIRFHPYALARKHCRELGLCPDASPSSATSVVIPSGRAFVDGALLDVTANQTATGAALSPSGSTVLVASTEYTLYAVARGMGSGAPVGKGVASGFVPVLVAGNPPTVEGRPLLALTYRPLFGAGVDNLTKTTTNALYLGTLHTDSAGNFQTGGDGIPLNRDGSHRAGNISPGTSGFPGSPTCWVRKPWLSWVDANTVRLGVGVPSVAGILGVTTDGLTAAIPGNLVSGDIESASTWYYLYLRNRNTGFTRGVPRDYVLRFSSEAPNAAGQKPTPETGYASADYLFAGSVFNNSASNIEPFFRQGEVVTFRDASGSMILHSADIAVSPARTAITARLPSSSRLALCQLTHAVLAATTVNESSLFRVYNDVATSAIFGLARVDSDARDHPATLECSETIYLTVHVTAPTHGTPGAFEVTRSPIGGGSTSTTEVDQLGYLEDLDQPRPWL